MLGEDLLPCMPRPLSFWFGLHSGSRGALGCVLVFFSFLSLVYSLKSLVRARHFSWFLGAAAAGLHCKSPSGHAEHSLTPPPWPAVAPFVGVSLLHDSVVWRSWT